MAKRITKKPQVPKSFYHHYNFCSLQEKNKHDMHETTNELIQNNYIVANFVVSKQRDNIINNLSMYDCNAILKVLPLFFGMGIHFLFVCSTITKIKATQSFSFQSKQKSMIIQQKVDISLVPYIPLASYVLTQLKVASL